MTKRLLVFRFSALGDVAMCVPILWSLRNAYPDHEILFVSRPFAKSFIDPLEGVSLFTIDPKGRHKGIIGLYRLFNKLRELGPWEAVIDLHDVLRTKILRTFFKLSGRGVFVIDKGRTEKKSLTRKKNKRFQPLKTSHQRYAETFKKAGYDFGFDEFPGVDVYSAIKLPDELIHDLNTLSSKKIGIAPFAKHIWKTWPEQYMQTLIQKLSEASFHIFLFGGPGEEEKKLSYWSAKYVNVKNVAGKLNLDQELKLMSDLDLMITMDSANMHFASLVGTRVLSVWGATHPYAGFYGYNQSTEDAVQVDLDCRPCSVFGNKSCHRGDFACMNLIEVDLVYDKVLKYLSA